MGAAGAESHGMNSGNVLCLDVGGTAEADTQFGCLGLVVPVTEMGAMGGGQKGMGMVGS